MKQGIFGIGNPYRQDDGIGIKIIDSLEQQVSTKQVIIVKVEIDIFGLNRYFDQYPNLDRALFIDAITTKKHPVGTILVFNLNNLEVPRESFATTTHNIGLIEYLQMLSGLNDKRLPREITIMGIVAEKLGYGEGISKKLLERIPIIIEIINNWLKGSSLQKTEENRGIEKNK